MKKFALIAMLLIATVTSKASAAELKLCFFADADVDRAVAEKLVASWNKKEGKRYDLPARVASFEHVDLNGVNPVRFVQMPVASYLRQNCDRNVGLVGRSTAHVVLHTVGFGLLGVPLPEALGGAIHSHMTVSAKFNTANQFIMWPTRAFRHELRHTLGCGHSTVYGRFGCKKAVADIKAAQTGDFLPVVWPIRKDKLKLVGGKHFIFATREEVNAANHRDLVLLYEQSQKAKNRKE